MYLFLGEQPCHYTDKWRGYLLLILVHRVLVWLKYNFKSNTPTTCWIKRPFNPMSKAIISSAEYEFCTIYLRRYSLFILNCRQNDHITTIVLNWRVADKINWSIIDPLSALCEYTQYNSSSTFNMNDKLLYLILCNGR